MNGISRLNHLLTRADVLEKSSKAPIRRIIMPISGIALASAVIASDIHHTDTVEKKRKVIIRDLLAVLGSGVGLFAGITLAKSRVGALSAYKMAKLFGRELDLNHMPLSPKAIEYVKHQPWGKHLIEHEHHHGHAHEHEIENHFKTRLGTRLSHLFKAQMHDHGIPGIIMLEAMAAGGIMGGVTGGSFADLINKEDLKKTLPAKLFESIFQFFGNITLCTIAILGGSWLAKGSTRQALKSPMVQEFTEKRLLSYLQRIGASDKLDLRRVPTGFTEKFEDAWLSFSPKTKDTNAQKEFQHELTHWFQDYYPHSPLKTLKFKTLINNHLQKPQINIKELREDCYNFLNQHLKDELTGFSNISSINQIPKLKLREDLKRLAAYRFEKLSERVGIILGLASGIVGGAYISNKINDFLAKEFQFEKPVNQATLFHSKGHKGGALQDKLGPRGIHWWDMVLHADDWPSAMYMAGVEMLEPIIRVLYGMSGYLTGVAGTSYSHGALPDVHPAHNNASKEELLHNAQIRQQESLNTR